METKICIECNKEKSIDDFKKTFHKNRNYLYVHNICKECYKIHKKKWNKNYQIKHKDEIKAYMEANKDKHKNYCKIWHKNNIEKEKEYRKINKEHLDEQRKEWRKNNIEKSREWHKNYKRKVRENELTYAKDRIRNMISHSFRRKGYTKSSMTYKILGANYEIVWEHLKKTWFKNYGKEYNDEPFEIDHIIPLATANTKDEIIKLCNYTNLQMLTPEDNLSKGCKL